MQRYRVLYSLTGQLMGVAYSLQDKMSLKVSTEQLYLLAKQRPVLIEIELAPEWGPLMCG